MMQKINKYDKWLAKDEAVEGLEGEEITRH